jgi:hypothetical protein
VCRLLDQLRPRAPALDEERRWLRARDAANGMVKVEAQLRPEEAARVLAACDAAAGEGERRVDGLLAMAEATLRGDKPERPPVEVMVHIDAGTLTGAAAGAGVSAETSRRLLCDAGVVAVLEDGGGKPLDVGRKQRVLSGALRRALVARDQGCRFPGCTHTRYLHGHHVRHWVDGGATSVENAVLLCTRHHALVHEGGFRVIADGGGVRFLEPDGREVPPRGVPPIAPDELPVTAEMPPTWDGDPVDYEAATAYAL